MNGSRWAGQPSGVFPVSDQLPTGRPYGMTGTEPSGATEGRPFGLRLSRLPGRVSVFDPASVTYDPVRQIGLIREGEQMVPFARHTDGQTNTQTNADGKGGYDSDTDVRED